MARLGTFGVARAVVEDPDTFEFFGEEFHANPEFGELDLVDFMEAAASLDEADSAALAQLKVAFRSIVAPADFDRFWRLAKKNHQGIEDLMPLYRAIVEASTQRPTGASTDSSDGRSPTPLKSVSLPADPAMEQLAGRPDMQAALIATRRARSA